MSNKPIPLHVKSHTATERRRAATPAYRGQERREAPFAYRVDNEKSRLIKMLAHALGPQVGALLEHDLITDVILECDGKVWADYARTGEVDTGFVLKPADAMNAITLVAHHVGVSLKPPRTSFPAELPESGWRFHAIIPPQTENPTFSIRKKAVLIYSLDDYVKNGELSEAQRAAILGAVVNRRNIIVAGGTGSGKTTLVNAVLREMAMCESGRIISIEDTLELQNIAKSKVVMRTVEGGNQMRDLVKDALRMKPSRIVVGEVRGGEVVEMLKAWNTGHPGGICTLHANSANETLFRIEDLILDAHALVNRESIARTIQVIIFIAKIKIDTADGPRQVRRITDIMSVEGVIDNAYQFRKIA